nr:MAG TPA: hypothetical protein [Caudoviricetes sp.]DAV83714.1 MAG TPA: hypothetical protein [Caudoviricetes sp.]
MNAPKPEWVNLFTPQGIAIFAVRRYGLFLDKETCRSISVVCLNVGLGA